jgi:hypothetical protein
LSAGRRIGKIAGIDTLVVMAVAPGGCGDGPRGGQVGRVAVPGADEGAIDEETGGGPHAVADNHLKVDEGAVGNGRGGETLGGLAKGKKGRCGPKEQDDHSRRIVGGRQSSKTIRTPLHSNTIEYIEK